MPNLQKKDPRNVASMPFHQIHKKGLRVSISNRSWFYLEPLLERTSQPEESLLAACPVSFTGVFIDRVHRTGDIEIKTEPALNYRQSRHLPHLQFASLEGCSLSTQGEQ